MFNFVDCLQKGVVRWPNATMNIVRLPLKENTGMSMSFRGSVIFAGLVVMVLGVSQVVIATQSQDPAASSSETSKAAKSQTKSKKTKKKKAANTSFVVLGSYAPQTVALPSASASITPVPADPIVTPRRVVTAEKSPSIHILPVEDPPASVASAGD